MKFSTLDQIARILETKITNNQTFKNFSIDSRTCEKGNIYVALRGNNVDGHLFLKEAALKGCVAAIVDRNYTGPVENLPLFGVDDPLTALQQLAKVMLERSSPRSLVGITGSAGKTTTKEFLATILKKKNKVGFSPSNSNSQAALPLAILNHLEGDEESVVLEMGMSYPGEIRKLVSMATPDIALITNIGLQHAANFESLEGIARAKGEIFCHEKTQIGFIPHESAPLLNMGTCLKETYSIQTAEADHYLLPKNNWWKGEFFGRPVTLDPLPYPGNHFVHNFFGAALVAGHLGFSWEEICAASSELKLPEKRQERVEKKGVIFINDSYNSGELALKAALDCMPNTLNNCKKIAVLGEILELGKFSSEVHERLGRYSAERVDHLLCIGEKIHPIFDGWKEKNKPAEWFISRESLLERLRCVAKPGDVVLVKGSKYFKLWEIVQEF